MEGGLGLIREEGRNRVEVVVKEVTKEGEGRGGRGEREGEKKGGEKEKTLSQ